MTNQFEPLPWPDARFEFLDDDSGGFSFHCIIVPLRQRTLDEGSTSCILGALLTTLSMPIATFFLLFVSFLYHRRSSSHPQAKLCLSAQRAIVLAVTGRLDMGLRCVSQRNANGKRAEELGCCCFYLYRSVHHPKYELMLSSSRGRDIFLDLWMARGRVWHPKRLYNAKFLPV